MRVLPDLDLDALLYWLALFGMLFIGVVSSTVWMILAIHLMR